MVPPSPQSSASTDAAQNDETRAPANHALALMAERELLAALAEQVPPALGMYYQTSRGETAAFNRAAQAICREAHRLDLHAEELVIAVKRAWSQLATARANRLGERDADVLREVVSSSIEIFFESRDGGGDGRTTQA